MAGTPVELAPFLKTDLFATRFQTFSTQIAYAVCGFQNSIHHVQETKLELSETVLLHIFYHRRNCLYSREEMDALR